MMEAQIITVLLGSFADIFLALTGFGGAIITVPLLPLACTLLLLKPLALLNRHSDYVSLQTT